MEPGPGATVEHAFAFAYNGSVDPPFTVTFKIYSSAVCVAAELQ